MCGGAWESVHETRVSPLSGRLLQLDQLLDAIVHLLDRLVLRQAETSLQFAYLMGDID